MPAIGPIEIAVVLVIVLLIVGPTKLPGMARSAGSGVRGFKDALSFSAKPERPASRVEAEDQEEAVPGHERPAAQG